MKKKFEKKQAQLIDNSFLFGFPLKS